MSRAIIATLVAWIVPAGISQADPQPLHPQRQPCSTVHACRVELARARHAIAWQAKARRDVERHARRAHRPGIVEAAQLAAQAFGISAGEMLAVAACESHYNPFDVNGSSGAAGVWQFLPSTWRHTPFARWSPTNVYAQALATAQIVAHDGGWRQWVCKP